MIILDTSIWIEYLRNNQKYFPKVSGLMEGREILAIDCVFGELLQGTKNASERAIILDYWTYLPKENHDHIIVEAGLYSAENKFIDKGVGLIDAVILMCGIKSQAKIWTLDTKFLKIIPTELQYRETEPFPKLD